MEVVAGRYELEELVGTGGMASVYRAHDKLLERKVALKILHEHYTRDEEYVERFRREARAAAQLSHPNIVTVIDRGEQDGRQFIVFEYIAGQTLKDLVDERGPLPVRRALELLVQVARALAFAHDRGLVHRDVKPQNVLLNGDGRPMVTDFGIARSVDVEGATETGTVLGTSDYIAPEQASGEHVDAQTDIYSLGVVLYELLTGEVPFTGDNFVSVALRHVNEQPPSVLERRPDVPLRLVAAVDHALAKDPDDRFSSMAELVDELEACLAELGEEPDGDMTMIVPGSLVRAKKPERKRELSRRRRVWPLALAVAAIAAASAGAFALISRSDDPDRKTTPTRTPKPVELTGLTAYDPEGDGSEHNGEAVEASDGDPLSSWTTETYSDFDATKTGVGLILDTGRPIALTEVTIATDTPGFKARIRAGDALDGRFTFRSAELEVRAPSTKIEIRKGLAFRYWVVWITELGAGHDNAHVNEVSAKG